MNGFTSASRPDAASHYSSATTEMATVGVALDEGDVRWRSDCKPDVCDASVAPRCMVLRALRARTQPRTTRQRLQKWQRLVWPLPKATSDGETVVNPMFAMPDRQLCIHRFYPGRLLTRQPFNQRRVLLRRADADTQELGYSQLFEVPHDHALRTQFCGQRSRIVLRVAGKDEVGR